MFNIFAKNVSDTDVLFYVCRKGDLESVKVIVDKIVKNPDKKLVQDTLYSALVLACINGFEDIIIFLLSLCLNVNVIDDIFESTALIEYCRYNNSQIIELLINKGAEVNKQNNKGITPLMTACAYNNSKIIELLIHKGADINLKSHYEDTPLTLLCNYNNRKIIELLIKKGSDLNLKNMSGFSALNVLKYSEHKELKEMLLSLNLISSNFND